MMVNHSAYKSLESNLSGEATSCYEIKKFNNFMLVNTIGLIYIFGNK
jgi:hypothetical protein